MSEVALQIGLSAWIIQDGNYGDFECGTQARFALEFYAAKSLSVTEQAPRLTCRGGADYSVCGVVQFAAPNTWVVDFDGVRAFCDGRPPDGVAAGMKVAGEIYLGVDPFFYFETLCELPGIPPLIYSWEIEGIAIETAPFIQTDLATGGKALVRDQSKLRRIAIPRTNAWTDDGGNGDYVLTCRRLPQPPSRNINNER